MENVTKAMIIGGSVLIAIIVMAVMIYAIRHVGTLRSQTDINELTEQIAKFNQEYEAYNKKIMYGVDILSCLNKAMSNNEKYVSGSFLTGDLYTKKYIIDVAFKLNSPLQDRIRVDYLKSTKINTGAQQLLNDSIKISSQEYEYTSDKGPSDEGATYNSANQGTATYKSVFKKLYESVTDYKGQVFGKPSTWWDGTIKSGVIESQFVAANPLSTDGFYHLLAEQDGTKNGKIAFDTTDGVYKADFGTDKKTFSIADSSPKIKAFLAAATDLTIDVKHVLSSAEIQACSNDKQKATLKFLCVGSYYEGTVEKNAQGWSSARWETSLYDFKKRKFKCESITYSEETGRIVSIVFTEYK